MKLVKVSARKFGLVIKRLKKISGLCPKCGHPVHITLKISNIYECPCGFFSYYADSDTVFYDSTDHPDEYWKIRAERNLIIQSIRGEIKNHKFRCKHFPDYKLDLKEKIRTQIVRISEFNERQKNLFLKYNLSPIEFRETGLDAGDFSDSPNIPPTRK